MGNDYHRHPLFGQGFHHFQDPPIIFGSRADVGSSKSMALGAHGQSPGDGHPLLLSTRELVGIRIGLVSQPYFNQQVQSPFPGLILRQVQHPQRGEGHIVQRGHMGEEVKSLENHADVFPDAADVSLGSGDVHAIYVYGAAGWLFQEVEAAQEGALARSARGR